ncbi:MAG: TonB-dependent receptor, partial [Dysgonamonadaceae bacterium]|nr:TonB-dependent receptor [Dysgonamonadaceae bacterium]
MSFKKILLGINMLFLTFYSTQANVIQNVAPDSISTRTLSEVVISASTKETNDLKALPASVSSITAATVEGTKIIDIKDLSLLIPNFFLPDYGSRLSVPVYIRGIGERTTGQSIGMYVDNAPYLDKSVFDFDFLDIRQIDVLRGPQGTLYGRNAMSGIVHVITRSPLEEQYGKVSLTTGNYGLFRTKVSAAELLSDHAGLALSGYYDRNDGYFTNQFSGEKADPLQSAGAKLRFDWQPHRYWTIRLTGNYDKCDQGAFPYGNYSVNEISKPNYDYPGHYQRQTAGSSLNLNFTNSSVIVNSNTAFLYFDDSMKMDTDYTPADVFRLHQQQRESSWTEEITVKSNTGNRYQWLFGAFGFYNTLKTNVTTTLGSAGVKNILQTMFDQLHETTKAPQMTVTDPEVGIPGDFQTPTQGGAIFHQSTYNHLFTKGLSVTAGIRLDYEKTRLDYDTHTPIHLDVKMPYPPFPVVPAVADTVLQGRESTVFTEILPKAALKYTFTNGNYVYATVSNGYKAGGYNIQNFADLAQDALKSKYIANYETVPVKDAVTYQPEYSWNYEIGYKGQLFKNKLSFELAAFYIDVTDIQLTQFVASGQGRILKNAGKAQSLGAELGLTAQFTNDFLMTANYGFTRATFKDYQTEGHDYSGNYIPFAPQNTLSLSALYQKYLRNQWIDRFYLQANYQAAGKIHWTEANNISQDFYG